jgi:ABC-type polysaccharide/polyol phosphate export permease
MMGWLGYVIAMTCVRYRDMIQLITTWLMVWFFITPVMWKPDFLSPKFHFIIDFNPLAQFLELLRNPLLGEPSLSLIHDRHRALEAACSPSIDWPLPTTRDLRM